MQIGPELYEIEDLFTKIVVKPCELILCVQETWGSEICPWEIWSWREPPYYIVTEAEAIKEEVYNEARTKSI